MMYPCTIPGDLTIVSTHRGREELAEMMKLITLITLITLMFIEERACFVSTGQRLRARTMWRELGGLACSMVQQEVFIAE